MYAPLVWCGAIDSIPSYAVGGRHLCNKFMLNTTLMFSHLSQYIMRQSNMVSRVILHSVKKEAIG